MASSGFRLRVTYRKSGALRFLSHLEVCRGIERVCRRAAMPYAVSQGFNPRMRVAFGPALPVGTAGMRERFDVWLTRYVPAAEALEALVAASPLDLRCVEAVYVGADEPALSAGESLATYVVAVEEVDEGRLERAIGAMVGAGGLTVEHKGKTKVFDLARSLPKEPRVSEGPEGSVQVELTIRIGPEGSIRPEMLLAAASRTVGAVAVVSVTRTDILQVT